MTTEQAKVPGWLVASFEDYWKAQGYTLTGTEFDREDLADAFSAGMQAQCDATSASVTEHATRYPGGAYHVRWADLRVEKLHPLAEWIENEQRQGSKVYRRRVIEVEDWAEVQQ